MDKRYNNVIVKKAWGSEYLAFQNKDVALWVLNINKDQSTSLHCHSKKMTGLICLSGQIKIDFLADSKILNELDKNMIRRGLFHKTTALSNNGAIVLELETPNNKRDLLRLSDNYGRENNPYEEEKDEILKTSDCLWLKTPRINKSKEYQFKNKKFLIEHISSLSQLKDKNDNDLILLLSGGFYKKIKNDQIVSTESGDVGYYKIMKQVVSKMDGVCKKTIILTITNNE